MQTKVFSLLEILISTSVIAILITLLIPSFISMRENANSLRCSSHLKQLGFSTQMYLNDNSQILYHEDSGTSEPPTGFGWYEVLLPYLGNMENAKYRQEEGHSQSEADPRFLTYSYKMNTCLEDYKGNKENYSPVFRDISTIKTPQITPLFFDGRFDKAPYSFQPKGHYSYMDYRHNNQANILMVDFSISSFRKDADDPLENAQKSLVWDPGDPPLLLENFRKR